MIILLFTVTLENLQCASFGTNRINHYQIRFKAKNGNLEWKFTDTDSDENNVNISGLMAHTKYIFQVGGIFGEQEGPYGPANEDIETKMSLATTFLDFSI